MVDRKLKIDRGYSLSFKPSTKTTNGFQYVYVKLPSTLTSYSAKDLSVLRNAYEKYKTERKWCVLNEHLSQDVRNELMNVAELSEWPKFRVFYFPPLRSILNCIIVKPG